MTLLRAVAISKSYSGVHALRGVSFDLRPGEVHALIGENGAGKSTLTKIFTGAAQPDSGVVEFRGQPIIGNSPHLSRSLGIAAIYQQPALFPDLTVAENIALSSEPPGLWRRVNWQARHKQARIRLEQIGSTLDPDRLIKTLSMPEQQLVEIAKALGSKAQVLILDEPTASLTDREVRNLFRVIHEWSAQGAGIIYISHRLEELAEVGDRVTILRDGAAIATREMAATTIPELINLMVGRDLTAVFPSRLATPGEVMLEVRGSVNFRVHAGEILGLAGLVGAGRTALAEMLFGLRPSAGIEIRVGGRQLQIKTPSDAMKAGLAYVPQDRRRHGLVMEMPVSANVTLASLGKVSRGGFLRTGREREMAERVKERLSVKAPSVDVNVENLSGGNQQKVLMGRWLQTDPGVLILDEPTQGVDVGAKAEIHRIIGELASRGVAVIMISSELPEILGMCDRIAVMRERRIEGILSRDQATAQRILALALGAAA